MVMQRLFPILVLAALLGLRLWWRRQPVRAALSRPPG